MVAELVRTGGKEIMTDSQEVLRCLAIDLLKTYNPDIDRFICQVCKRKYKLLGRAYLHIEDRHLSEVMETASRLSEEQKESGH